MFFYLVQSCYYGSYDGVCSGSNFEIRSAESFGLENADSSDYDYAESFCSHHEECLGYGIHYQIDRYYWATDETSTLECSDPANNNCGDGTPTNGCRVKMSCPAGTVNTSVAAEKRIIFCLFLFLSKIPIICKKTKNLFKSFFVCSFLFFFGFLY